MGKLAAIYWILIDRNGECSTNASDQEKTLAPYSSEKRAHSQQAEKREEKQPDRIKQNIHASSFWINLLQTRPLTLIPIYYFGTQKVLPRKTIHLIRISLPVFTADLAKAVDSNLKCIFCVYSVK